MTTARRPFRGFRFPAEIILWAVRWYLRFPVSYRDLEAMLADRGAEVDHVTLYRWVQRFAPELEKRLRRHLRPCRGAWHVDELLIPSANSRVAVLPLEVTMSLRPEPIGEIPAETARIARAAFPKGTVVTRLRDEFSALYQDEDFGGLYPNQGQPALTPWRLALVTVFQFLENLSDRQAADAVRARIDWKYALGLELSPTRASTSAC